MEKNEKEKEQPNLFGDADFIYNVVNCHVLDINDEISKLLKSKDKIDEKVKELKEEKSKNLEVLSIVGKEIKKSRPEEEETAHPEPQPEQDPIVGEEKEEEEIKEAEVIEEDENIELEEEETEEETEKEEESENPFE